MVVPWRLRRHRGATNERVTMKLTTITAAVAGAALIALTGCSSGTHGTEVAPTTSAPSTTSAPVTTAPTPATDATTAVACWRGDEQNMSKCMAAWQAVYPMGNGAAADHVRAVLGDLDGCTSAHGASPTMTRNPFPMAACADETAAAIAAVEAGQ